MRTFTSTFQSLLRSPGGLRSLVNVPTGRMIVLGEAPLLGVLTGQMALEVCEVLGQPSARLWTLYNTTGPDVLSRIRKSFNQDMAELGSTPSILPYYRICADAPAAAHPIEPLQFWLNPHDDLTQAAGLGSQWLEPLSFAPRNGLILAQLNSHMLSAESIGALKAAGLLIDHGNLEDHWTEQVPSQELA